MNRSQVLSLCILFLYLLVAGCTSPAEITETAPAPVVTEQAEPTLAPTPEHGHHHQVQPGGLPNPESSGIGDPKRGG